MFYGDRVRGGLQVFAMIFQVVAGLLDRVVYVFVGLTFYSSMLFFLLRLISKKKV
jgi:hypothetical protein